MPDSFEKKTKNELRFTNPVGIGPTTKKFNTVPTSYVREQGGFQNDGDNTQTPNNRTPVRKFPTVSKEVYLNLTFVSM